MKTILKMYETLTIEEFKEKFQLKDIQNIPVEIEKRYEAYKQERHLHPELLEIFKWNYNPHMRGWEKLIQIFE